MPTIFSKLSKPKKITVVILFTIAILSLIIISYTQVGSTLAIVGPIVMAVTIGVLTFYKKFYQPKMEKNTPRRGWSEQEKEQIRIRQGGVCNKCGMPPPRWEYHHRDGNRSNNNLSNCEGLCPNCHSVKTHDE